MSSSAQKKALASYRRRLQERGIVRLELQASKEDVPLLRRLAKVLRDEPKKAVEVRRQLKEITGGTPTLGLKELLASAPLEGIDLSRHPDRGREVDL